MQDGLRIRVVRYSIGHIVGLWDEEDTAAVSVHEQLSNRCAANRSANVRDVKMGDGRFGPLAWSSHDCTGRSVAFPYIP